MVIVQVNDVGLEGMNGFSQHRPGLCRPNHSERVQVSGKGMGMKVHIPDHKLRVYQIFGMLHAKEGYLVSHFFKMFGQPEHIGFAAAI